MKKLIFIMPLMAISLLASCDSSKSESTYTIIFKNEGEEDKKIENIKAGSIVTEGIPTPTKQPGDAEFIGWCTDTESKNVFDFSKIKIYQDYTLYSGWETSTYTVTLDAGEGTYITGQKYDLHVKKGTNLSNNIKLLNCPFASDKTFAYYTYANGNPINYSDIVTSDIKVKAHYFNSAVPLENLDSPTKIDWNEIKAVAITNGNPNYCFALGATKKVEVNGKNHSVRIIGFNHDKLKSSTDTNPQYAGITFEFANVITNNNGGAATTHWNDKESIFSNNYEYSKSTLNDFLNVGNESIFNNLPDNLKADGMIEEVYKPVAETPAYKINTSYTTKLFPLSFREITVGSLRYVAEEGTTYAFYINNSDISDRIKKIVDGTGGEAYWLRSPYVRATYVDRAWDVEQDGAFQCDILSPSSYVYTLALGVAPAFCI